MVETAAQEKPQELFEGEELLTVESFDQLLGSGRETSDVLNIDMTPLLFLWDGIGHILETVDTEDHMVIVYSAMQHVQG